MPGFTFPSVGPLCIGSPPSRTGFRQFIGTMFSYDCQQPISGSFTFARPPIPCISSFIRVPSYSARQAGWSSPTLCQGSCLSSVPLPLTYDKEPADCSQSDALPSYVIEGLPRKHMPRSQTPVVSCALALSSAGLLPSGRWTPSAFPRLLRLKRLSY
jgi:hypothetical protein